MTVCDKIIVLAHNESDSKLCTFEDKMSLVTRKPVFGFCEQVRLKPVCSGTHTSYILEVLDVTTRGVVLSMQRTTNALFRLRGCAGWSAPLLFAYGINRFSHDVTQIVLRHCSEKLFVSTSVWIYILIVLRTDAFVQLLLLHLLECCYYKKRWYVIKFSGMVAMHWAVQPCFLGGFLFRVLGYGDFI